MHPVIYIITIIKCTSACMLTIYAWVYFTSFDTSDLSETNMQFTNLSKFKRNDNIMICMK